MVVLIVGGAGRLGTAIVERLTERDMKLRVLGRDASHAKHLPREVEVLVGDVRDPQSLTPAVAGAQIVISSVQALSDPKSSPEATDHLGNRNLIDAAKEAGAEHFILVSALGAAPDHPMSISRAKYHAERYLKQSGLAWTLIRPSAFMEFWATLIGKPLVETGKTRVFGPGKNPMNFVSVSDVAAAVERAIVDPSLRGVELDMGGPENLSLNDVVAIFEKVSGRKAVVSHMPLAAMRIMSVALRPINPAMARVVEAGIAMNTIDQTWDGTEVRRRYPWLPQTRLIEVIQKEKRAVSA